MYWPRFRLTPEEAKYNSKYENPKKPVTPVIRRMYNGELNITPTIRQDQETFQISRRSRVFGLTASGDVNQIEVQISDITGEQFTTDFIAMNDLILGTNWDPRAIELYNPTIVADIGLFTGFISALPGSYMPFIFEPNIVLAPNQTLSFAGRPIDPERQGPLHVSFNLHVWEFPGMPGSPL